MSLVRDAIASAANVANG